MARTTLPVAQLREFAPSDGGGINLNVAAGRIRNNTTITDQASQVVALTDDATNFVELSVTGVATDNTSAFTSGSIPIAEVVTASGDITSVTDKRSWVNAAAVNTAAPVDAQYVTLATDGTLTVERTLAVADTLTLTDAGAGSTVTIAKNDISARVTHASSTSIADVTSTTLAFDTERFDTDTIHDNSTNNSRLTATTAGKYYIFANIVWAANATGTRAADIVFSTTGNSIAGSQVAAAPGGSLFTQLNVSCIQDMGAASFVTLLVFQNSTASLNVVKTNEASPEFGMIRLEA